MSKLNIFLTGLFLLLALLLFAKEAQLPAKDKPADNPPPELKSTTAFYDSLSAKSERNWLLGTIYPMLFIDDPATVDKQVIDPSFERWKGKTIRSIQVISFEVFQPDSLELQKPVYKLVTKAANAIHLNTREWVIRQNLFFRSGDKLVPETMRRNLIYLRNLHYLKEANILISNPAEAADSVDIIVAVQDKFSIIVGGQFASFSNFQFKLDDQNILGLGQQLRNTWHIDPQHQGSLGWESFLAVPNIRGTFIRGELEWRDLPGITYKGALLNRPFLFPVKRAAGGADIAETFVRAPYDSIAVDKLVLGGWYGYSLRGTPGPANQYAYAAFSLEQSWHFTRPEIGQNYGRLWHDTLLGMGSIALTQSAYRRLPMVYSFLENDDIPVGYLLELLFGYESGEFRNRQFLGWHGSSAQVLGRGDFIYVQAAIESFFARENLEQGVLAIQPLYISPIHRYHKFSARTLYKARLILGKGRLRSETLKLSTDPFFRGNRDLGGTSLIATSVEEDIIAPWNILGFQIGIFGFVEGALITDQLSSSGSKNLLFTEGLGVRLRNPRLIWESVELHVALSQAKGHYQAVNFALSTKVPLKLLDFEGRRPRPFKFQ